MLIAPRCAAFSLSVWLGLAAGALAHAPGAVAGRITDPSGLAVANVVMSAIGTAARSAASAVTVRSNGNGEYSLTFRAAGEYRVAFEYDGFQRQEHTVAVGADTVTLDIRLELAAIPQTIKVTQAVDGSAHQESRPGEVTFATDALDRVPAGRSPEQAALMAPGVGARGPNNALTMAGAFSYGNLFLVDGLPANENTRGLSRPFFIQDAVLETRVATGAVPVEYGRFQGGVVQTITRSGSNTTAGSIRIGITNDNWRALTPYRGDATLNHRVPTWEVVLGGPVIRNTLYYFGAAQGSSNDQGRTLSYTNGNYTYGHSELKYQIKGTWTPSKSHTLRASYFRVDASSTNASTGPIMDRASLYDNESPESLSGISYNAMIGRRGLLEARYSTRRLTYSGSGSQDTTLEGGTPIWDRSRSDGRSNSPQGCATCPGSSDERNNQDAGVKLWWSPAARSHGPHQIVAGVDAFQETRRTNAYQSGSSYRVRATRAIVQGEQVYPVFLADRTTWIYWQPILRDAMGNDLRTYSAFASDTWRPFGRLTVRAGVRFDLNDDRDSVGARAVYDAAWSPRIGVTWDPAGNGAWLVNGGWSRYVTSINSNVADAASPGGRPATYIYDYLGPAINANAAGALTPPHDALRTLFDWFLAAPGTSRATRSAPVIPGVNVQMAPALGPLDTREIMAGVTRRLGARGSIRIDGIYRRYLNFYATERDMTTGRVTGPLGSTNDLMLVTNATKNAERSYKGLLTQVIFRPVARVQVSASYTLAWTTGNVDGEDAAVGPSMVTIGDYPEYREVQWSAPSGPLATDQRHRGRLWATWELKTPPRMGRVSLGLVLRVESGVPWSAVGSINPKAYVVNPGYVTPPTSVPYYFSPRGAFRTDTLAATDLSLNWSGRLPGVKKGQWFVRGILTNAFNRAAAIRVNKTVLTRNDSTAFLAFNPFKETPVRGVHYGYGSDFGQPISPFDYQAPREFSISFGIRY